MVRKGFIFNVDHEIKEKFMNIVGIRNMSNDIEDYMKSRVEEYEKLKNIVAPDQGTTNTDLNSDSNLNSNSNDKSVTLHQQEKIELDVLNTSRSELTATIQKINDKPTLGKVQGTATLVAAVTKTRLEKLK